jgi:LPLT family lysophospholipid transporter-like MFS transporter
MNKQIYFLLLAQFLTAFADNAILFTVIAIVMHSAQLPNWYIPALQSVFLVAYVILGPWVGSFADNHPKSRVLIIANIIKAVGAGLLFLDVEPLIAYCIVGAGAATYSPAKYGILPELVDHEHLVKANSWIEGSTIFAILAGMMVGAKVADYSTHIALAGVIGLFLLSALSALPLPVRTNIAAVSQGEGIKLVVFYRQIQQLFSSHHARFAVLGGSLFWAAAASLRVIFIAWASLILLSKNSGDIADNIMYLSIGIIFGAGVVPWIIPLEHIRRVRFPAYLMGLFIIVLSFTESIWPARGCLFLIGIMGGMYIVPINALLQEQGKQSIGSGSAVSVLNFFQNLAMLLAVGSYTFASYHEVDPVMAMSILGFLVLVAVFFLTLHLADIQKKNSA